MKVKQECPECAKVGDATRANNRFMYHIHYVRNGRLIYLGKMKDASKLCRTYKKSRIVVCDRREHTSRTWWQSEDFPGERYENLLFEGGNFGVPDKPIMWEDVPEVAEEEDAPPSSLEEAWCADNHFDYGYIGDGDFMPGCDPDEIDE
jgi:hypothetical protein